MDKSVRNRIRGFSGDVTSSTLEKFETGVDTTRVSFEWTIKNFDLVSKTDSLLKGQKVEFTVTDKYGLQCKWRLSLRREPNENYCEYSDNYEDTIGFEKTLVSITSVSSDLLKELPEVMNSTCTIEADPPSSYNRDPLEVTIGTDALKVGGSSSNLEFMDDSDFRYPHSDLTLRVRFVMYSVIHDEVKNFPSESRETSVPAIHLDSSFI